MKRKTALATVVVLLAAMAPVAVFAAAKDVPRQVLAFYYGWYGNPQTSGRWLHWRDVDEAGKKISSSQNWPKLGPYDSHNPKIVEQHYKWARNAGLTGFIVTWWRQGDFHDQGLPLMLDTAKRNRMSVTVYYETAPPRGNPAVEGAVSDIIYILERYGRHPAWLRVDDKPVIFVYGRAIGELKLDGWKQVIEKVNAKYPAVFIGDRISAEAAEIFDGIHTYNPTGQTARKPPSELREWAKASFPKAVQTAGHKISTVTIIPGYDDTTQKRKEPRPITSRHNGQTYDILWQEAIAANPDWVLITSWNEWHEGSEIEPSLQDGDRALRQTARYTKQFLKARRNAKNRMRAAS
ncbi:MAG TPA: glycoside hydrolase family 99-like domain-containing protein [Bryobacteraceae bacterium]|nr:glycoside hydrolase family 99-like domain-containing protein [Bryobacteraceae bacterium]